MFWEHDTILTMAVHYMWCGIAASLLHLVAIYDN